MTTTLPDAVRNSVLDRVLAPDDAPMTVAVAREILKWGFSEADHKEMSDLAAKARAGTLTRAEELAITEYGMASSLIGIVKSKARRAIESDKSGSPL